MCFVKQSFTVNFNLLLVRLFFFFCSFFFLLFALVMCWRFQHKQQMSLLYIRRQNDAITYLVYSWLNAKINTILPPGGCFWVWFLRFLLITQRNSEGLFCFSCCNRRKKKNAANCVPDSVNQPRCVILVLNLCPNSHWNEEVPFS